MAQKLHVFFGHHYLLATSQINDIFHGYWLKYTFVTHHDSLYSIKRLSWGWVDPWAHRVLLHLGAQSSRRHGPTLSVVSVLFCPLLTVFSDGLQLIRAKALKSFSMDSTFLSNLLHIQRKLSAKEHSVSLFCWEQEIKYLPMTDFPCKFPPWKRMKHDIHPSLFSQPFVSWWCQQKRAYVFV